MYRAMRAIPILMLAAIMALPVAWGQSSPAKKAEDKTAAKSAAPVGDKAEAKTAEVPAKPAVAVAPDYVIGVEDVLGINVWREPEMSRVVAVRPDGKITLPLLGEFEADGKTPKELEAIIVAKIQTLVTNPEVSVIVQEIRSQKFNVVGEVVKPGTYVLSSRMTVLDAIAVSGGFKDFAKPKKMYILRKRRDGTAIRIPVNYPKIISGDSPELNVTLETRDTIVVP